MGLPQPAVSRPWRLLVMGWLLLPQAAVAQRAPATVFTPRHLSAFDRRKAEWLLHERLPCLGCHRLGERGGAIGPDLTGVAGRRSADFVFRMITNPQATL